ncbi:MAG: RraA family protein [Bryobacteraceae bacterium]|jgi:regulator of RNase E activity RraA
MNAIKTVNPRIIEFLQRTDTCSVSNAIETSQVRMRDEGFIQGTAHCSFPHLGPVAGYAVTGRISTSAPLITNLCYYQRMDWWRYITSIPAPRIIVMADVGRIPGTGAFVGEIHARIARALGCVAYVGNGTIRDVEALEKMRFPCFAGGVSVSHSYAHVIDFGDPVEIGGLRIAPGDLLHGDRHGVQTVPAEIADHLPAAVARITAHEASLIELCQSPDFSLEKLAAVLEQEPSPWPPPGRL